VNLKNNKLCFLFLAGLLFISANLVAQNKFAGAGALTKSALAEQFVQEDDNPIDVLHYDVDLSIDPEARAIHGMAELCLRVLNTNESSFYLNLINLTVDSVFIDNHPSEIDRENDRLFFPITDSYRHADSLTLTVYYHGHPGNDGFGGFFFTDKVIYTVGEGLNTYPPSMLRYWIPSHDVPSDKATFDLRVTVPGELYVVSNGELVEEFQDGDRAVFHYREKYPIATYLVAVSVSNFASFTSDYISTTGDTIPLRFYAYPEHLHKAKEDWKDMAKMIAFFEEHFTPYPFEKYGMVEVPMRGAMEHQTMTSYSSGLVTGDHRYDFVVVHELAHQWWGDLVTLSDWREIWLNEGFASYCEALYVEEMQGRQALQDYMDRFAAAYFTEAGRMGDFPIYDPDYLWGNTVYKKGAWVLHMLRWVVGDRAFWEGMQQYARTFAYQNASIKDFENIFEIVSGKDLDWFFQQWLYKAGVPQLEVAWETGRNEDGKYDVELQVSQKQDIQLFYLPLEIQFKMQDFTVLDTIVIEEKEQKYFFTLNDLPQELTIDPSGWMLKKVDIVSRPLPPGFVAEEPGLAQNYPNPFVVDHENSTTKITIQVSNRNAPMNVSLEIYDVLGRKVRTLVDKRLTAGLYVFSWDGRDGNGIEVSAGVYIYKLETEQKTLSKKMLLLRN